MTPFNRLTTIAASLPVANVDTDQIIPGRFLTTVTRAGLGPSLFATMRERGNFVLNRTPWDHAGILIAGPNFGSGSSREHAPWALLDFGIRCVIAPSIADIFYNNCFKNGILPIVLAETVVASLASLASNPATARMTVDLETQVIEADGYRVGFDIDSHRRADLLGGVDEIARSLSQAQAVDTFEEAHCRAMPWLAPITQAALTTIAQS